MSRKLWVGVANLQQKEAVNTFTRFFTAINSNEAKGMFLTKATKQNLGKLASFAVYDITEFAEAFMEGLEISV